MRLVVSAILALSACDSGDGGGGTDTTPTSVEADVADVDATVEDSDVGADDVAPLGGFFLQGHAIVYGADAATIRFAVHDDLGIEVPVIVHTPAPEYRLEVPPLPDFERRYVITFSVDSADYVPVQQGVRRPGWTGDPITDTVTVPPVALTRGMLLGLVDVVVDPESGALWLNDDAGVRVVEGGATAPEPVALPAGSAVLDPPLGGRFLRVRLPGEDPVSPRIAFFDSESGALIGDDDGLGAGELVVSPIGQRATIADGILDTALIEWDGASLTITHLPVLTRGWTPDAMRFLTLGPELGGATLYIYDRALGAMTEPLGEVVNVAQLGYDASFVLKKVGLGLALRAPGDESDTTLADVVLDFTVSTSARAWLWLDSDPSSGALDVRHATLGEAPRVVATIDRGAVTWLAADDRVLVLEDQALHVFDVASGAELLNEPGAWGIGGRIEVGLYGVAGSCGTHLGAAVDCRRALVDVHLGTITMLADEPAIASPIDGFFASGARRFESTLGREANFSTPWFVRVGDARVAFGWDEAASGTGATVLDGFRWPASYHAPCVPYVRSVAGIVLGDAVPQLDVFCVR